MSDCLFKGCGAEYDVDPSMFMDKDVIIVSINYRYNNDALPQTYLWTSDPTPVLSILILRFYQEIRSFMVCCNMRETAKIFLGL